MSRPISRWKPSLKRVRSHCDPAPSRRCGQTYGPGIVRQHLIVSRSRQTGFSPLLCHGGLGHLQRRRRSHIHRTGGHGQERADQLFPFRPTCFGRRKDKLLIAKGHLRDSHGHCPDIRRNNRPAPCLGQQPGPNPMQGLYQSAGGVKNHVNIQMKPRVTAP